MATNHQRNRNVRTATNTVMDVRRAKTALREVEKEKVIISGIVSDLENWCSDIRKVEFKASLALKRGTPSTRIRTRSTKITAADMDDEPVEKGDAVEMPAEGAEGKTDPKDIGLVIEVTDPKGESMLEVEVSDGEVVEVQSSKVRKISDKTVARKIRFASLRRRASKRTVGNKRRK